jgi:hypothetical protein
MLALGKRFGFIIPVLGALLAFAQPAMAQTRLRIVQPAYGGYNPNPQIAPGVTLMQYAYNTAVLGRAYSQIPPYMLGYNPYPNIVAPGIPPVYPPTPLYGPSYGAPGIPYGGGYGSYGGSPYAGGYGAGGVDPLTGLGGSGGYSANPLLYNPYAGGYGSNSSAWDLYAFGQLGIDQEKARILRETANQAKLDTRKKLIDTLAYIRANEYTFTKEQADIAKRLLERVQKTPTQAEIQSGRSLNILLKDLVAFKSQDLRVPTVMIDSDVLKLVNVSGAGSSASIGLLRDNGQVTWPLVFDNKEIISEKDKKDLDLEAKQLYLQAANGPVDPNLLRNVETALRGLRANLAKQANDLPANNFLAGQRFLDDFDSAVLAVKNGDVALNVDFQQKMAKGTVTVQELVSYMGGKGLQFAAATPGDERGYAALQAALATHSVAIHNQIASATKE